MNFDNKYFINVFPEILSGLDVTFSISLLSFALALVLGAIIALIYRYKTKGLYQIAIAYVSLFRGTPVITQLYFVYFGLPYLIKFLRSMDAYTAATLTIAMNMSAYISETIRGSLASVDKGQIEAGLSVGMTNSQVIRRIVFPQAIRIAIPPLSNNFIMTLKGTAVAFTIGVTDIMANTKMEASDSYRFFECYAAVMIIYWVIVLILTYAQKLLEDRLDKAY